MYIGEVAKKTGLSIKAIRLYEEKGLIPTPQRLGRYRVYTEADIELLLIIKEVKRLGITLAQLRSMLPQEQYPLNAQNVEQFLREHRAHLRQQIQILNDQIRHIDTCLGELETCPKMA
ncbi:MAG: MerR family transcriptional regulator [Chloroflexota bacterium]